MKKIRKWICTSITTALHIPTWEFRLGSLGLWSQCLVIENGFFPTNHTNLVITDIGKGMSLLLQHRPCAVYSDSNENRFFFFFLSGILSVITFWFRTPGLTSWSFHWISNPLFFSVFSSWFIWLPREDFSHLLISDWRLLCGGQILLTYILLLSPLGLKRQLLLTWLGQGFVFSCKVRNNNGKTPSISPTAEECRTQAAIGAVMQRRNQKQSSEFLKLTHFIWWVLVITQVVGDLLDLVIVLHAWHNNAMQCLVSSCHLRFLDAAYPDGWN